MKKLTVKQKRWQGIKSKKGIEYRKKYNRKHEKSKQKKSQLNKPIIKSISSKRKDTIYVHAPKKLSVVENPAETLGFFKDISNKIKKIKKNEKFYFNLSKVEYVTVDAIMFLIAIIKNTRKLNMFQNLCMGNVPINETAKKTFENSGFYKYVRPKYSYETNDENEHISITSGREANPVLAGDVCDFVIKHSEKDRLYTKPLFKIIMELMTNTNQHAYNHTIEMDRKWFVFVENKSNYMNFVFLDTGAGIPNTIRTKGIFEKIQNIMNYADAYFISSALRGEFRSETTLDYRGKGLPSIYEHVKTNRIKDFIIVSGFGMCTIEESGEITETKLTNELKGTILTWKLYKDLIEGEENDYNNN